MSRVKLGDVAREYKATVKDASGLPIVGLEHLTPGEITLDRWDEGTENTFTKEFKKGQVLFGRRRAYLKKAALAPFDGVCSGDITVIEAIPGKILPDLLPFIIQNDLLFDYAVGKSAGSLSPRVKWIDLKDYEFELPEIGKQAPMVELLQAAHAARKAYKELIQATDDLVKSQFIDMFGDPISNDKGWKYAKFPEVTTIVLGSTPRTNIDEYWDGNMKWISPAEITDDAFYIYDTVKHITELGAKSAGLKSFPAGTVLFSTRAPIGKTAIAGCEMYCNQGFKNFICGSELRPVYLYYLLRMKRDFFEDLGTGTTFKELSRGAIEKIAISIPPLELQDQFETLFKQSDKSKFVAESISNRNLSRCLER